MSLALVPAARELPAAVEAERAVLGAVLVEHGSWDAASALQEGDFLLPCHRAAWEAIRSLAAQGVPADVLLVWDRIVAAGSAQVFDGGLSYFADLPGNSSNVTHYVEKVRDASTRRKLILALSDATKAAYDGEVSTETVLAETRSALDALIGGELGASKFSDLSPVVMDAMEARWKRKGDVVGGAKTGLRELDITTGGLQPGWLTIIAAETGGGKTALAMQTAINVVLSGGTALALNLEMTKEELTERALIHVGHMNSQLVRLGEMEGLWRKALDAERKLAPTNFYFDDSATTIGLVCTRARRWRAKHKESPGILVVDFVQLLRSAKEKGQTRAQEVGQFAQELKALAKELKVPVILVSQLNRAGVKAGRPSKSDLKESGDLENAADLILMPWNEGQTSDGIVKVIVDKFRHGECRTYDARWIGRHYRFTDPSDWE